MEHLKALLNSYAEIFFLSNSFVGILLLGSTFINPNVSIAGLMAMLSAYLFARFLKMEQNFLKSGFYTYNALLVGLSVGAVFRITPISLFFIASLGILTFLLTHSLSSVFSYYFSLPILSLPFVMISSLAYLASTRYSNLFVNTFYPQPF